VGTSLLSHTLQFSSEDIRRYEDDICSLERIVQNPFSLNIKNNFDNRKNPPNEDKNPAEISSLYGFKEQYSSEINSNNVKVVLVHSPGIGKICANKIKYLIENSNGFFNGWKCELEELTDLDINNINKFKKSVEALTDIIREQYYIQELHHLYLNITGGYKALLPYLTMIGMAVGKEISAFYLFEDSPLILRLPVYPFSFDLRLWRDWRGILGPFDPALPLKKDQKKELYGSIEKTRLRDLINKDKYEMNKLGQWMNELYEKARETSMTEFGEGEILFEHFKNGKYTKYLKSRIPYWRHFATGDHIPETVEHGRGHVQRLLELAQQLIIAADLNLTDEELFVLICSIWLHDLGHSGDGFHFEGKDGIVQDRLNPKSTAFFPVFKDPNSVRKYHNFLSYELLNNKEEFIFSDKINEIDKNGLLRKSIRLACLYHRQVMPLGGVKEDDIFRISKGINDFKIGNEVIKEFPLIAAILRFIDAADNQVERAYSKEHFDVTEWVLKRQSEVLENELKKNGDSDIKMQLDFKRIQAKHFNKHRLVKHVYIVKGVVKDDKKKSVSIINIANMEAGYNRQRLLDEIITGFYEEFNLIEELLPFQIQIFIYEKKDTGKYDIIKVKWDATAQKAV
jgi:CRISPR/Cas system-associated protein Csm6